MRGIADFGDSFAWFRRTPKAMQTALIPAAVVWVVLAAAVVAFLVYLPQIAIAVTPFANDWNAIWAAVFRVGVSFGLFGAVIYLSTRLYRGLVATVGEFAYVRLRRAVAEHAHSKLQPRRESTSRLFASTILGFFTGIPLAIAVLLLSLIPVVGFVLGRIVAAVAAGRELGEDLVRSTVSDDTVIAANRARITGFGIAANLTILIPFAGVVAMPVAVAGATALATNLDQPGTGGHSAS